MSVHLSSIAVVFISQHSDEIAGVEVQIREVVRRTLKCLFSAISKSILLSECTFRGIF